MATEDVEEFCIVSHVDDGTTHIIAHPSYFCVTLYQINFQISLKNGFVLATFIDAGRRDSSCAIKFGVIVSLTALHGHSSGKYHFSV